MLRTKRSNARKYFLSSEEVEEVEQEFRICLNLCGVKIQNRLGKLRYRFASAYHKLGRGQRYGIFFVDEEYVIWTD